MRALILVLVVVASGCDPGSCKATGKSAMNALADAAPGAVLTVALAGCSTCAHSHVSGYWSTNTVDSQTTGTVELQLSPSCFVKDVQVDAPPRDGNGIADGNFQNCGDTVDYSAYMTNRTNVTFDTFQMTLVCPSSSSGSTTM